VLVDAQAPDYVALRAHAIGLLLPPGAAIARETAAWLFGVDTRPPGEHLELPQIVCVVPAGSRAPLRRPGIRSFQASLGSDIIDMNGVPCTSPLRTTVDLLRFAPPFIGLASADALAGRGWVTPDQVVAEVERWQGGRYIDRARRLAGLIEPESESPGESWLRLRIVDAGFPRPEVQVWVPDDGPCGHRLDLGYSPLRKGVEYDGETYHDSPEQRSHDERRRRHLEKVHGWAILAVGRGEVLGPSLALEYGLGEFLGMEPQIRRRLW
jgi:hypothetical protein